MRSGSRSSRGVSEQRRRRGPNSQARGRGRSMRRAHDFPQPAGKDERAERRGDPPVQRHEGGETWVHIGNPGYILVRGRDECVTGDEPERRLLDVRLHAGQGGDFLNWRDGRFLMYELLDSLKTRLALPPIEFDRLLPEERVDVAIAPGDAGAASVLSRGGWPVLAGGGDLCSGGGSSVECAAP